MAISFSCPNCKAHVQVGDELAGAMGQCPLCQRLLLIPSNAQPMPILLGDDGNPVSTLEPAKTPRTPEPKLKSNRDDAPRRTRRKESVEIKPSGPMWPWALGIFGGIVVVALLFSSFLALFVYRPFEPSRNIQIVETTRPKTAGVLFGRMDGNRAFLQDGVFQVRSALTLDDERDANFNRHQKRYWIELRGNTPYNFDVDSTILRSTVRVEDRAGDKVREDSNPFPGNAATAFIPPVTDIYTVIVTSTQPAFGEFALTVYEQGRMKPPIR